MGWEQLWMNDSRQSFQSFDQRGRGRIQELVWHTKNFLLSDRLQLCPTPLLYYFCQRHAVSRAAPCHHDNVGSGSLDLFRLRVCAGSSEKFPASGLDQLRHPSLRVDQRPSPLFAIDQRLFVSARRLSPHFVDLLLHMRDCFCSVLLRADDTGDHREILVDIFKAVRSKAQERNP